MIHYLLPVAGILFFGGLDAGGHALADLHEFELGTQERMRMLLRRLTLVRALIRFFHSYPSFYFHFHFCIYSGIPLLFEVDMAIR